MPGNESRGVVSSMIKRGNITMRRLNPEAISLESNTEDDIIGGVES